MTYEEVQGSLSILRLRQKAVSLAVILFENSTTMEQLAEVSQWLDQSSIATDRRLVLEALDKLRAIAKERNIALDT